MGSRPTLVILLTFLYKILFPVFWTPARGIYYHPECYWPHNIEERWPSGLRPLFKAPVTSMALDRVPLLSFCLHSYIKVFFMYFEHQHMVSSTIIHANDQKPYRQDGRVVQGAGLRHQALWWRWFESHSCYFFDLPIQSLVSFILNVCTWDLLPLSIQLITQHITRVAKWS